MDADLDLSYYARVVVRHWKAAVIVFVVATLAAALVSVMQHPAYQATVTLTEQSFEFYDEPRLAPLDRTVVKLYPTMARSDAVEARVIEALGESLSLEERTPGVLLLRVTIREDKDNPAVFRISVEAGSPEKAVLVANAWAEQYTEVLAGFQMDWDAQLRAAEDALRTAEEDLTSFRADTGLFVIDDSDGDPLVGASGAVGVELEKRLDSLAEHRVASDNLRLLIEDARLARDAGRGTEDLPLHLLNAAVIAQRGVVTMESVERLESMDSVIQVLESEQAIIDATMSQLSRDVEGLQQNLAEQQLELEQLTRSRDLAEGVYKVLSDEIQEGRLFQTNAQILSRATRAKPVGPSPVVNSALGAALGLVGGLVTAFALEYSERARLRS
jgi:capsular polysaccharide biosynthesis protein